MSDLLDRAMPGEPLPRRPVWTPDWSPYPLCLGCGRIFDDHDLDSLECPEEGP